jgi:enoyl-CoA hydratase
MTGYQSILYGKEEGVAIITFNLPHQRNAVTAQMAAEIDLALTDAEGDTNVAAVVLTGGEKFFAAGMDVSDILSGHGEAPTSVRMYEMHYPTQAVFRHLSRMSKPTIAAIAGYAFGGALEMALCCDFRIATENTKLGLPEITLGIMPGAGGTQRLSRIIGIARAKELVLRGETILADQAYAFGLLTKVVKEGTLLNEAKVYASKFTRLPPFGVRIAKTIIDKGINMGMEDALELEKFGFCMLYGTEDQKEGLKAFADKRPPQFKGK